MWYIGDNKRPQLGIMSGPEGWKTREECEQAIKETIREVAQLRRQDLKDAVKRANGNLEATDVKYHAGELERALRHSGNLVPIQAYHPTKLKKVS